MHAACLAENCLSVARAASRGAPAGGLPGSRLHGGIARRAARNWRKLSRGRAMAMTPPLAALPAPQSSASCIVPRSRRACAHGLASRVPSKYALSLTKSAGLIAVREAENGTGVLEQASVEAVAGLHIDESIWR